MVRIALLLLTLGGLVVFALQNLSPIALVILGTRTLALPLAAWVLGAMAAGALTTLILSGLRPSRSGSERRASNARTTGAAGTRPAWNSPDWSNSPKSDATQTPRPKNTAGFSAAGASRRAVDDWETRPSEDWDDWGNQQEAAPRRSTPDSKTPTSKSEVRDTADEDWANWEGYEEPTPRDRNRPSASAARPRRTEFEARQTPKSTQQSGSVYSASYRDPQDSPTGRKTNEVYDAEYRVIIPPYNPAPEPPFPAAAPPPPPSPPTPEPVVPPPEDNPAAPRDANPANSTVTDEDDWGDLEDLLGDLGDKPNRPG